MGHLLFASFTGFPDLDLRTRGTGAFLAAPASAVAELVASVVVVPVASAVVRRPVVAFDPADTDSASWVE